MSAAEDTKLVLTAIVEEIYRQQPGTMDLSEAEDLTQVQIFGPLNLQSIASQCVRTLPMLDLAKALREPLIQNGGWHLPPGTKCWRITNYENKMAAWCENVAGKGWVIIGPEASWADIIEGRAQSPD